MTDKALAESPLPFIRRKGQEARVFSVNANVTESEQKEIYDAIHEASFKSASDGVRSVLLGWARGKILPVIPSNERRKRDRRKKAS